MINHGKKISFTIHTTFSYFGKKYFSLENMFSQISYHILCSCTRLVHYTFLPFSLLRVFQMKILWPIASIEKILYFELPILVSNFVEDCPVLYYFNFYLPDLLWWWGKKCRVFGCVNLPPLLSKGWSRYAIETQQKREN